MKMKKLAFIDHSYHKKTKAVEFLNKILSTKYEISNFWDDSWDGGNHVNINDINKDDFDVIVFFQILPPPKYLNKLKYKQIVWFPMYDQEVSSSSLSYIKFLKFNITVFSFSKTLHKKLKKIGFTSFYYQFFMKPEIVIVNKKDLSVFFWQRTNSIDWEKVKLLLEKEKVKLVYYKNSPDPKQQNQLPSDYDIKKYNIKFINGWIKKDKYFEILSECNVFIAPRKFEGIGMSFIEAISRGMIVLSPDNPTMNEYITNGINGYLYNLNKPVINNIDLSISDEVLKTANRGFKKWQKEKSMIVEGIENNFKPNSKIKIYFFMLLSLCLNITTKTKLLILKK